MKTQNWLLLFSFMVIFSCKNENSTNTNNASEHDLVLDSTYDQIQTIASVAQCQGVDLQYTTEVHSTSDGYTFFRQRFEDRPDDMAVVLPNFQTGFSINRRTKEIDTLDKAVQEVIRAHEFHKMSIFPKSMFENLRYAESVDFHGRECDKFSGVDRSGLDVELYYNPVKKRVEGLQMINMLDTTETILVTHKSWTDSEYGKLLKSLELVQAGKDTFTFEFTEVEINGPDFIRREL